MRQALLLVLVHWSCIIEYRNTKYVSGNLVFFVLFNMARGLKVFARLFQIEQVKILETLSRGCLQIKKEATEAKSTLGDLKMLKMAQSSKQLSLF